MPKELEAMLVGGPPRLGPETRPQTLSVSEINSRLKPVHGDCSAIRALLYLWHDHLEASHQAAQSDESLHGSYLHGMMHRREPDYGNAKYWFRRAPTHPVLAKIGAVASKDSGLSTLKKLLPGGVLDPLAFVDFCETASGKPAQEEKARLLQEIEFRELLRLLST